ncbi:MAG: hypothetical protein NZ899_04485 [Thermoguttaceae bacterium]|nr:hypothetical protein [Thermoguttaceae bacterium]MDW8077843.1 CpsB/CapC family capsule biosynthesis tyrosine phosphatase [Thermoguttaceae bacterium]
MEGAGFVDIHCHILPGLDDGPSDWQEALQMARLAVAQGVTHLVATPHQLGAFSSNSATKIADVFSEFQRRLAQLELPLKVFLGADVRIEPELPARLIRGEVLPIGPAGRYVLVELPFDVSLPLLPVLEGIRAAGFRPILTHPERSLAVGRHLEELRRWVNGGGVIQLTGGSLVGSFGVEVQARAERLLREGLVHVVASDAHGALKRRPLWRRVYERLEELLGEEPADLLCHDNPACILAGQDVCLPELPSGCLPRLLRWMYRKAS